MLPGPILIKKCTVCFEPFEQYTISSGNTFNATLWTDGKLEAPMLTDKPRLVMCPYCRAPLWIDELEVICSTGHWGKEPGKFLDARKYSMPSLDDYFELLANGVVESKKELYVRLRAWWLGNDKRRANTSEIPMSSLEIANLTEFAQALNESDADDLIMKAEAMRELGRFADALFLLAKSTDKDKAQVVKIIRSLTEKGDSYVRKLENRGL